MPEKKYSYITVEIAPEPFQEFQEDSETSGLLSLASSQEKANQSIKEEQKPQEKSQSEKTVLQTQQVKVLNETNDSEQVPFAHMQKIIIVALVVFVVVFIIYYVLTM